MAARADSAIGFLVSSLLKSLIGLHPLHRVGLYRYAEYNALAGLLVCCRTRRCAFRAAFALAAGFRFAGARCCAGGLGACFRFSIGPIWAGERAVAVVCFIETRPLEDYSGGKKHPANMALTFR